MARGRQSGRPRTLLDRIRGQGRQTLAWVVLSVAVVLVSFFWLEGLLAESHGSLAVTVRGISGSPQYEDRPVLYRYRVEAPNGLTGGVSSRQLFEVGSRLRVTLFKNSITGRSWLRDPELLSPREDDQP